jgi:hypothetical protein
MQCIDAWHLRPLSVRYHHYGRDHNRSHTLFPANPHLIVVWNFRGDQSVLRYYSFIVIAGIGTAMVGFPGKKFFEGLFSSHFS